MDDSIMDDSIQIRIPPRRDAELCKPEKNEHVFDFHEPVCFCGEASNYLYIPKSDD